MDWHQLLRLKPVERGPRHRPSVQRFTYSEVIPGFGPANVQWEMAKLLDLMEVGGTSRNILTHPDISADPGGAWLRVRLDPELPKLATFILGGNGQNLLVSRSGELQIVVDYYNPSLIAWGDTILVVTAEAVTVTRLML